MAKTLELAEEIDGYTTLRDLASETGIARPTLYMHIQRGNLRARKLGHMTLVARADAAAFKAQLQRIKLGSRTMTVFAGL